MYKFPLSSGHAHGHVAQLEDNAPAGRLASAERRHKHSQLPLSVSCPRLAIRIHKQAHSSCGRVLSHSNLCSRMPSLPMAQDQANAVPLPTTPLQRSPACALPPLSCIACSCRSIHFMILHLPQHQPELKSSLAECRSRLPSSTLLSLLRPLAHDLLRSSCD